MPNAIPIHEWLKFVDDEYLSTFIKDGGASIKFAVTPDDLKEELYEGIKVRCQELDYVFVNLDAALMRAYMPQDIFFGLASQIDWRLLARRLILRLAVEKGYRVEGIAPIGTGNIIEAIANANGLESQSILFEMRPAIQGRCLEKPEHG